MLIGLIAVGLVTAGLLIGLAWWMTRWCGGHRAGPAREREAMQERPWMRSWKQRMTSVPFRNPDRG